MIESSRSTTVQVVRWIARVWSAFSVAMILLIFIGEGISERFEFLGHLSSREATMMFAFAAVVLGLVLGWKWELYGGVLTVCGVVAFYLANYLFSGTLPRGPYFLLFAFPSLLFIYCGLHPRGTPTPAGA